jgi:hypothetical protein
MSSPLLYCPHVEDVLGRLHLLYEQRAQDRIFAVMSLPSATLREFAAQHPAGFCEYPDPCERARFWDAYLAEHTPLYDDAIPSAYLSEMDQGLYGGLVGGDVRFLCDPDTGWISSMVAPILPSGQGLERLPAEPDPLWMSRYQRQMEIFVRAAQGKFAISHFILIDSLNFAFELFGATRTYELLLERPELIAQVIDYAFELNVTVQEAFFRQVPLLEGGTCSTMAQWLPGRIVSESVDPFHMTSVAYFERWGREPVERILACFDGGVLHIHGNGRHLLEAVSTIRGLKALYLGDDRGFPLAFDVLKEIKQRTGDLPLVVTVDYGRFSEALRQHRLSGGVLYMVKEVPSLDEANRCMDLVRAYRV